MFGWLRRAGGPRSVSIDEGLWQQATGPLAFMQGLTGDESARLKRLCEAFIGRKQFSGTHGLELTDAMQVEIAAQACILVLELGGAWYDGWSEVIVYPSQFAPKREVVDHAGVVHLTQDAMSGEAWLGGPVILSYEDVALNASAATRVAGYNVVIHEFAHKLDMRNGDANGFPPLHADMPAREWKAAFGAAYEDFCARVDAADAMAGTRAQAALDALPIDPYAAESPGEFFAVASEAFFETPALLRGAFPSVYAQLARFYRQDPATRMGSDT